MNISLVVGVNAVLVLRDRAHAGFGTGLTAAARAHVIWTERLDADHGPEAASTGLPGSEIGALPSRDMKRAKVQSTPRGVLVG